MVPNSGYLGYLGRQWKRKWVWAVGVWSLRGFRGFRLRVCQVELSGGLVTLS